MSNETTNFLPSSTLVNSSPVIMRLFRRALHKFLSGISTGRLVLIDGEQQTVFGHDGYSEDLNCTVVVENPRFYQRIITGGSIGAAESYIDGDWHTSDLTRLIRIFIRNKHITDEMEKGLSRMSVPMRKLLHLLHRNTRAGSRKNIAAHYDLGNEFFRLFLDDTMMYSCGVFPNPDSSLYEASTEKNDRICRKLDLKPSDHLLEIGTGWGGLALHAAAKYGCRITTTTISAQQYEFARERIRCAALEDRITVLNLDYRDLSGTFDKIVSIEMVEAIGHQFLDIYAGTCSRLLKPDGLMLLQSITIDDREYERARDEVDFIKRYIFPGSFIPSVTVLIDAYRRNGDLKAIHMEDIGPHYARTLRHWRSRLFSRLHEARSMGYSQEFLRMWGYYFCLCEGGFEERYLGNIQLLLAKPLNRRAVLAPEIPLS